MLGGVKVVSGGGSGRGGVSLGGIKVVTSAHAASTAGVASSAAAPASVATGGASGGSGLCRDGSYSRVGGMRVVTAAAAGCEDGVVHVGPDPKHSVGPDPKRARLALPF